MEKNRIAGKHRMVGKDRVAASLLGGVRGWVYFNETSHPGITA
jgi:hypothetical protein